MPLKKTAFFLLVFPFLSFNIPCSLHAAVGEKAMVVTPDPRATQAALEILKQGGNAVDAAVAAEWVLNVVEPQSSGLGGGGLFLFYDVGTRRILFFDGSVKAPAKISSKIFFDEKGNLLPYQPDRNTGGSSVGIPGLLKLTEEVHAKYGTHKFTFEKLFEPAIQEAEKGTKMSPSLAKALEENKQRMALLGPLPENFLEQGGEVLQPELAKTFRLIQKKGTDIFYKGAIAKEIGRTVRKSSYRPGFLRDPDLEDYTIATRDPIHITYQGYDLFSAGPPASGGTMLFRALNVLSHFGMSGFGQTPETYHLLAETQKVALMKRSGVADPDVFDIPVKELFSEAWAEGQAKKIKFDQVLKPGEVSGRVPENERKRSGSSILVVDAQGNIAVLSSTLGDEFGSALKVPGYGFFLNNLLTEFSEDLPSTEDQQAEDMVSGGQRPRGPEAPTLIFKEGKPVAFLDAYGPDDPAALLLGVLVQKIDLKASCASALGLPRLLVRDGALQAESGLYDRETMRVKLELLGHKLEKKDPIGFVQIVCFDEGSDKITGESDLRGSGAAAGF